MTGGELAMQSIAEKIVKMEEEKSKRIEELEKQVKKLREYVEQLKDIGFCTTCDAPIDTDDTDHYLCGVVECKNRFCTSEECMENLSRCTRCGTFYCDQHIGVENLHEQCWCSEENNLEQ